jgi:hypothetical protein
MSELQVPPDELMAGDTILAISPSRHNFKVRRPEPATVITSRTVITRRITFGELRRGDVIVCPEDARVTERVRNIQPDQDTVVRRLAFRDLAPGGLTHQHERSVIFRVVLLARAEFIVPGWKRPENCERCSRLWRNWLDCTCMMNCGRPLDCNGLR